MQKKSSKMKERERERERDRDRERLNNVVNWKCDKCGVQRSAKEAET